MTYTLFLGNKRYSSWSLRGWLLFDAFGAPFEERLAPMRTPEFEAMRAEMAPSRLVPTVAHEVDGERRIIWESLSIAEYLAERFPNYGYWPRHFGARAWARSLAAEAHAGFGALRRAMPMNLMRRYEPKPIEPDVQADIERMLFLWTETRARYGADGPYLFGASYCVANAFFTPYATRLKTYGRVPDGDAGAYLAALLAHPSYLRWHEGAEKEPWLDDRYEYDA